MEFKRVVFILSVLVLIVLSACQMGTATPLAPVSCNQLGCPYPAVCDKNSGQCVINVTAQAPNTNLNNPGPAAAAINPNNSSNLPALGTTCNQTGCPYPAICDKNSGQCVIYQPTAITPGAKPFGGVGAIAANPGNAPGLPQPASCTPPVPSLSKLTSFCANQASHLGGATVVLNAFDAWYDSSKVTCSTNTTSNFKLTCSGPQSTSFQILSCGSCGASTKPLSNFVCASGYHQDAAGHCEVDSGNPGYYACPGGAHYDNTKQACVDDSSSVVNPQCPGGYNYYLPDQHACLQNQSTEAFNCQTFTIPLGECLTPVKKNPGPCMINPMTGACQP